VRADATLNVRLNKDLKQRGDSVLAREGISTTHAVRMFYQYLDQNQEVPTWVKENNAEDTYELRRKRMRELVGIAGVPENYDVDDLKRERLSHLEF
jgi:addiction module RelB/DinJ family antitoxin